MLMEKFSPENIELSMASYMAEHALWRRVKKIPSALEKALYKPKLMEDELNA